MIIVFEDQGRSLYRERHNFANLRETPLSSLFLYSTHGSHIYFSCSNRNLASECKEHLLSGEKVLIFCDVPPDNAVIVSFYINLVRKFMRNKDVSIIPMVCIEYHVLLMLNRLFTVNIVDGLALDLYKCVINNDWARYLHLRHELERLRSNSCSLEVACKYVLNNTLFECLKNTTRSSAGTLSGCFYNQSCANCVSHDNCKLLVESHCSEFSRRDKAELLYSSLPCFYVENYSLYEKYLQTLGVVLSGEQENLKLFAKKQDLFYKDVANVLGTERIMSLANF